MAARKKRAGKKTGKNEASAVWAELRAEAEKAAREEPMLRKIIRSRLLSCETLADSLAILLSDKLDRPAVTAKDLKTLFSKIYADNPALEAVCARDLLSVKAFDPAATDLLTPFLFFKGFHALQSYRLAHALWLAGRKKLALFLQSRMATVFGVDIHPAARIGGGVTFDHATGIVIGETAVVGDDVLILHNVTLGTKGYERGDRHPLIGNRVTLGAGAKVLGRIRVGDDAYVAAGSLVIKPVVAGETVAGVPAKPIRSRRLA